MSALPAGVVCRSEGEGAFGRLMATEPVTRSDTSGPGRLGAGGRAGARPRRRAVAARAAAPAAQQGRARVRGCCSSCWCWPAWPRRCGPNQVAKTGPNENHLSDTITVDGEKKNVVELDGVPIGPQYLKADGKFFLGADPNGRDIMVRLLYGGRNSLVIGITAALHDHDPLDPPGRARGLLPGLDRHRDQVAARRDLVVPGGHPRRGARRGARAWGASSSGRSRSRATRSLIPILIIGLVYVPYMARPVRGPGAVAAREGVRRGRARPGRRAAPDHVQRGRCRTWRPRCWSSSRC